MGSSETVYFELTDLRLHIRTTIRNEPPAIKLICVRFSALKGFIVSGRVPDLMERPKMKSDVVPGQNWKGGDFPAVSALASTQTFAKCTGKSEKCHDRTLAGAVNSLAIPTLLASCASTVTKRPFSLPPYF
jgi:hypothetical protein